jgi:hypothetical protein
MLEDGLKGYRIYIRYSLARKERAAFIRVKDIG